MFELKLQLGNILSLFHQFSYYCQGEKHLKQQYYGAFTFSIKTQTDDMLLELAPPRERLTN